jgi:3-hydroxyisobutyrate dehydrogenase
MELSDNIVINNIAYTLTDLEKDTWNRLVNGAVKSRDPFHTPCVATHSVNDISLRTVVLRKAIPESKELRFHTDTRSKKWQELIINPSISALFYDAADRVQLRVKGSAVLQLKNDITAAAWQKTSLSSRRCYLTNFDPSNKASDWTAVVFSVLDVYIKVTAVLIGFGVCSDDLTPPLTKKPP